jgi:hypothetical protein
MPLATQAISMEPARMRPRGETGDHQRAERTRLIRPPSWSYSLVMSTSRDASAPAEWVSTGLPEIDHLLGDIVRLLQATSFGKALRFAEDCALSSGTTLSRTLPFPWFRRLTEGRTIGIARGGRELCRRTERIPIITTSARAQSERGHASQPVEVPVGRTHRARRGNRAGPLHRVG